MHTERNKLSRGLVELDDTMTSSCKVMSNNRTNHQGNKRDDDDEEQRRRRPWADTRSEILLLIYAKLLPSHLHGTRFGSVCRNWHRLHSTAVLSNPLPLESLSDVQMRSVGRVVRNFQQPITEEARSMIRSRIVAKAGAWLLPRGYGEINCCFNPLLRYPHSLIKLPFLSMHYFTYPHPKPIQGAFSALPTARDWMILVAYGTCYFSTLRRGSLFWRTYDYSQNRKRAQICLGVAYVDEKFFCLFEKGDMLVYSVDGDLRKRGRPRRRMLAATKPLLPEQLDYLNSVRVVVAPTTMTESTTRDCQLEEAGGEVEVMVVSWERDLWERGKNNFRLLKLERKIMVLTDLLSYDVDEDDQEAVSLEEGEINNKIVILVKDELPLKTKNFEGLYHCVLLFIFAILFTVFIRLITFWSFKLPLSNFF